MRRKSFTVVEIMVVVLIVAVIIGAVIANVGSGIDDTRDLDVKMAMKSVAESFFAYQIAYGVFPVCEDADELIAILKADPEFEELGEDNQRNPKRRPFLESSMDNRDFWGNQFYVWFDANKRQFAILSSGKDGVLQTVLNDNIPVSSAGDDILLVK